MHMPTHAAHTPVATPTAQAVMTYVADSDRPTYSDVRECEKDKQ